ncbi:MAG TPA: hypothetical protein VI603_09285 [Saprospiraceae bacterium]|nr:hypothetical protein [Saprospiraceae bacterium]
MGFEEFGQSSMRSNRSLLKSTMSKYFRNEKGIAVNDKTELSVPRLKVAGGKRNRIMLNIYLVLLFIVVLIIAFVLFLM